MWAMGLLGLLVGVILLLAAAALVRYLSQTPSSGPTMAFHAPLRRHP